MRLLAAPIVIAMLLGAGLEGCKTTERISPESDESATGQQAAIDRAKDIARAAGYDVAAYDARASRQDRAWLVLFDHRNPEPEYGGNTHFGVRIDDDGTTGLQRGR